VDAAGADQRRSVGRDPAHGVASAITDALGRAALAAGIEALDEELADVQEVVMTRYQITATISIGTTSKVRL
jgi:hypothetical protein